MSSPENCTCAIQCPHSSHCIAMYVHEEQSCWSLCSPSVMAEASQRHLAADARINIEANNVDLATFGKFAARFIKGRLFAPIDGLERSLTLKRQNTTLAAVLAEAGFITTPVP